MHAYAGFTGRKESGLPVVSAGEDGAGIPSIDEAKALALALDLRVFLIVPQEQGYDHSGYVRDDQVRGGYRRTDTRLTVFDLFTHPNYKPWPTVRQAKEGRW